MTNQNNKINRIKRYIQHDIWQLRLSELPKKKAYQVRVLRIMMMTVAKFKNTNLAHAASAMTFFTLLSIIPIIAMVFGIAKNFISDQEVESFIRNALDGKEAIADKIIEYAHSMLTNSQGGLIAGLGFMMLIYSAFKLLSNIEIVFNTIWDVDKPRTITKKIIDYIMLAVLSPIIIVLVQIINVLRTYINQIAHEYEITPEITTLISFFTGLLPYTFLWFLFTILYFIMPNEKVKLKYAFIGGIIAGSAYQIVQWIYIEFQVGASGANAVYGSLAVLPLFLAQLQLGWTLILLGCTISYVLQNMYKYERCLPNYQSSCAEKKTLMALVLSEIGKHFKATRTPLSILQVSEKTDIPVYYLEKIIKVLLESEVLTASTDAQETVYEPAISVDGFSLYFAHQTTDLYGDNTLDTRHRDYQKIKKASEELTQSKQHTVHNIHLA